MEDWQGVRGVGSKLSQRILQERTRLGGFRYGDEIRRVKGVGRVLEARIRKRAIIGPQYGQR